MIKIDKRFIDKSPQNRPGDKLLSVRKIVIHYVGNPGTTAQQNVDYIDNLRNQSKRFASAHFFVDDDVIIQIIPEDEIAYHVGAEYYTEYGLSISSYPNARTIGIEFCHPEEDGKPAPLTYYNLVDLTAYLCDKYNLDPIEDVCRHNDITGKNCPKYYVDQEGAFHNFKYEVKRRMKTV